MGTSRLPQALAPSGFLLISLLIPPPVLAQARQDSVLLKGRVVDEVTGHAIAYTAVTAIDRQDRIVQRAEADEDGAFMFVIRKKEGVFIHATQLGYAGNKTPFLWFDGHTFFDLELRLDRDAILLAPLEVVARRRNRSPVLTGFNSRLDRGMGWYFTREEIERIKPSMVTDLIARVPGVHLASSGSGLRRFVQMSRAAANPRGCPAQVYLDGMHLNTRNGPPETRVVSIDDYVTPESVEGIEVYRGLSTVPAEFLNEEAKCGVVVVWTLRGT